MEWNLLWSIAYGIVGFGVLFISLAFTVWCYWLAHETVKCFDITFDVKMKKKKKTRN